MIFLYNNYSHMGVGVNANKVTNNVGKKLMVKIQHKIDTFK